jgi:nucleotide-binding universal stress UspA family protein
MRILVPLDGTAHAELAVEPAAAIAGHMTDPTHLILLSVLTLPELMGIEFGTLVERRRLYLEMVKATFPVPESDVETLVRYGDPVEVICAVAQQQRADLILMASHNQHEPGRFARRCFADRVAERSSVPAITLRRDDTASPDARTGSFVILMSEGEAPQSEAARRCAQFLAERYSAQAVPLRAGAAVAGSR